MNEIQIFNNEEFGSIRTVEENGQIWFCGMDVANALDYKNSRDAISRHCRKEGVVKCDTPTTSGIQSIVFINEPNLYRLITHSKLPSAEKFERWVFEEVLPALRKTGSYTMKKPTRPLTSDDYMEAAKIVSKCTPIKLKIVLDLLEKGGFDVPQITDTVERLPQQKVIIPDSISEFFDGMKVNDFVGTPTNEVYQEYVDYCEENGNHPISNIVFSKYVNCTFDTGVHTKRIDGKVRRVFVIEEV
jgi:prophage antirepressor-like protein